MYVCMYVYTNGNPLQYFCLENPKDRGDWQATVYEATAVRHNLVTKPPPYIYIYIYILDCMMPVLRTLEGLTIFLNVNSKTLTMAYKITTWSGLIRSGIISY